jgi:hypothetical protein
VARFRLFYRSIIIFTYRYLTIFKKDIFNDFWRKFYFELFVFNDFVSFLNVFNEHRKSENELDFFVNKFATKTQKNNTKNVFKSWYES